MMQEKSFVSHTNYLAISGSHILFSHFSRRFFKKILTSFFLRNVTSEENFSLGRKKTISSVLFILFLTRSPNDLCEIFAWTTIPARQKVLKPQLDKFIQKSVKKLLKFRIKLYAGQMHISIEHKFYNKF